MEIFANAKRVMKEDFVNSQFVQEEGIKIQMENVNVMVTILENTVNILLVEEKGKKEKMKLVNVKKDMEVLNVW